MSRSFAAANTWTLLLSQQIALEREALEQIRRGDLRGARGTLAMLCQLRPSDPQIRRRLSQVEDLIQRRELAKQRVASEPLRYAHAYIKAGRLQDGLKLLRAALAKDPNNARLRELALQVARRLREDAEARASSGKDADTGRIAAEAHLRAQAQERIARARPPSRPRPAPAPTPSEMPTERAGPTTRVDSRPPISLVEATPLSRLPTERPPVPPARPPVSAPRPPAPAARPPFPAAASLAGDLAMQPQARSPAPPPPRIPPPAPPKLEVEAPRPPEAAPRSDTLPGPTPLPEPAGASLTVLLERIRRRRRSRSKWLDAYAS
ncbi:MAG: tetratricopeptide repeat protein [Myxococcota bacterium]